MSVIIILGGGPNHDRLGFRYWKHPGPFNQFNGIAGSKGRFLAWWAVMTQAAFSYIGTEIVAIAGGEARNPRTGEKVKVPASKTPKFRAGAGLKEAVNGK